MAEVASRTLQQRVTAVEEEARRESESLAVAVTRAEQLATVVAETKANKRDTEQALAVARTAKRATEETLEATRAQLLRCQEELRATSSGKGAADKECVKLEAQVRYLERDEATLRQQLASAEQREHTHKEAEQAWQGEVEREQEAGAKSRAEAGRAAMLAQQVAMLSQQVDEMTSLREAMAAKDVQIITQRHTLESKVSPLRFHHE